MRLKLKRAIIAVALATIILVSFAALVQQQKGFTFSITKTSPCIVHVYSGIPSLQAISPDNFCLFTPVPTALSVDVRNVGQSPFNNSTRTEIYDFIQDNPGIQFRGICSSLGISVGLAQYHLGVLVKSGLVSFLRDGRYKRYFVAKRFSQKEMTAISMMRHSTIKKIFEVLLTKKQVSHCELASQVSITSQGLTWQMKRLTQTELVRQTSEGMKTIYTLDEASAPMLMTYMALVEANHN